MFIPYGEVGPCSVAEVAALRLRNDQQAAILRIPGEILVSILRQVIKTSPGYQEAVQLITSVCYHLRILVFGTPELWGFVSMRGTLGPLFLQRCEGNPISVVPYFMEGDLLGSTRILTCLNYWKRIPNLHLTRVELIEFCGTRENFTAVSWIFNYYMPNLETLTLASGALVKGIILPLEEDPEVWNINPSTQRTLKDVHLQQIFIPWGSNIFYGLSTLHLDYRGFTPGATSIPMDAFLEVISRSPRLEKCSLYFAIPQCHNRELLRNTGAIRQVDFPLLEELTLFDNTFNVAYLLRHLRFPATTRTILKVDAPEDQLGDLFSTLLPPNSRPVDHATRVVLRHDSVHEYLELEAGTTTIQYLNELDALIEPEDIVHETFTLPLMEATHRAGPQIRVLKIRLEGGFAVRPEVWKNLLEFLPNLEDLTYVPGADGDHQWPAFWNLLCQTRGDGLICRSLRALRIINTQGIPSDPVGCLAVRWKLGNQLGVFQLRMGKCERSLARQLFLHLRHFVVGPSIEVVGDGQTVSPTD